MDQTSQDAPKGWSGMKVIGVIVVVVVIAGIIWLMKPSSNAPAKNGQTGQTQTQQTAQSNPSPTDNSNASIDAGIQAADQSVSNLTNDSAAIDQSLNDTPVPQSQ